MRTAEDTYDQLNVGPDDVEIHAPSIGQCPFLRVKSAVGLVRLHKVRVRMIRLVARSSYYARTEDKRNTGNSKAVEDPLDCVGGHMCFRGRPCGEHRNSGREKANVPSPCRSPYTLDGNLHS